MLRLRTLRSVGAAVALTLATALLAAPSAPAFSGERGRIDWGVGNWVAGVQMTTSIPSASDPHVHVRFKRVGGKGQRQVRMGERHKLGDSNRWSRYHYTRPVTLRVGQKVIFTTERALPCEPAKAPLGVVVDMRVRMPGRAWSSWETWISEDHYLLDCTAER